MFLRPDDQAVGHEQRMEERQDALRARPLDIFGEVHAERRLYRERE